MVHIYKLRFFLTFILIIRGSFSFCISGSSSLPGYMVLVPTGKTFHKYPVLKPLEKTDRRFAVCNEAFEKTFLKQMVQIHGMVQQYLLTAGKISQPEPAYLLLSGRSGGFPMSGFYLRLGRCLTDKTNTGYVDLKNIEMNYAQPGSFTQIFPHELAHIYYKQVTGFNPDSSASYSSDIHYYSIVTDYIKAFNEGFAESFENISRDYETDSLVRKGIDEGYLRLSKNLPGKVNGYDRDFRWPMRAGFYRLTMLFWYQQLEDYKRYVWSRDTIARLMPVHLECRDPEKVIVYRNSCVLPDHGIYRNVARAASTEGVICSFFTRLTASGRIDKQVLKELAVINKYLINLKSGESPFHAFIGGYIREYPEEKEHVLQIYQEVTSKPFTSQAPPELWLLNRQFSHSCLVMAPFGGAVLPFYTFNLNTAGMEDILTFKGISREEASILIRYRDSVGSLHSIEDLKAIPGLDHHTRDILLSNRLVPAVLKDMDDGGGLKLSKIFTALIEHFVFTSLYILAFSTSLIFLIFYYRKQPVRKAFLMLLRTYGKLLLLLVTALGSIIIVTEPLFVFIPFLGLIILVNIIRTRKSRARRIELLASTLIIASIIIYSMI